MIEQEKDFYTTRGHDRSDEARLEARVADLTGKLAEAEAKTAFARDKFREYIRSHPAYALLNEQSRRFVDDEVEREIEAQEQAFRQSRAGKGADS